MTSERVIQELNKQAGRPLRSSGHNYIKPYDFVGFLIVALKRR